ncbi:uncharacterized protein EI90DRAFT_1596962 [Cantharellus anzutake]|uniref:uncharacterized protein n=1 Tax=Cantharellus anzutake TaxID=1750568 RepID=UPI001907A12B|nr:uncharacterized protein EI90DRAFT_1596962 [Cantharellus anzutake]KAF8328088.1 hypothetical protein EI90DRAFT_1596962 [Cantharellus anzutake]
MFKNTGMLSCVPSLAGFSRAFSPLFSFLICALVALPLHIRDSHYHSLALPLDSPQTCALSRLLSSLPCSRLRLWRPLECKSTQNNVLHGVSLAHLLVTLATSMPKMRSCLAATSMARIPSAVNLFFLIMFFMIYCNTTARWFS